MPVNYGYTENGFTYLFDDVFVPADAFRQGNLWTWGLNAYGQLGINTPDNRSTPVTTFAGGFNWKTVGRSAAIKTDGTLWIWGSNYYGQLGINQSGLNTGRSTPVTTFAGGTNWKQVSGGSVPTGGTNEVSYVAAIKTDGTLWTWGINGALGGVLGVNDATNRLTPVTTFAGGTNWKQVSCGYQHMAAIKTDGTLWVWGVNSNGRLGDNTTTNRSIPVTTFAGGTDWKQVACGRGGITAAIKTNGTLWTWGSNSNGSLGDNTVTQRNTPVTTFAGGNNWKQVACGNDHTAAIKIDGTLWTWGGNLNGQLGINNADPMRCTPVTTSSGGTNWKQVSLSTNLSGAVRTNGTLWMWGTNNLSGAAGALGTNSITGRVLLPTQVFGGETIWKEVSVSFTSTAIQYIDDYV